MFVLKCYIMNTNVLSLYKLAKMPSRKIIGLMSGTSLDGLDIVLCEISGSGVKTAVKILNFETVEYMQDFKIELYKVFAKETINFQNLILLNEWIGNLHGDMINSCLRKWNINNSEIDLIASHGQTVLHAPKSLHKKDRFPNATLQIGDGDHIAIKTGIITISDFRQKHLAGGGEGAPLAVYGDFLLFSQEGENRIMLNIGGISNFTLLLKSSSFNDVFVTDTGTGNTLIDAVTNYYFPHLSYDKDAEIALQGNYNIKLLNVLKENEFFTMPFPKTTGPELFNLQYVFDAMQKSHTNHISVQDLLATLVRFSAETIADALNSCIKLTNESIETFCIYLSGGGVHNPLLVTFLKELLPCKFLKSDDLGIDGNAKEAALFAILANETVAGDSNVFVNSNNIPFVSMGKISFPN